MKHGNLSLQKSVTDQSSPGLSGQNAIQLEDGPFESNNDTESNSLGLHKYSNPQHPLYFGSELPHFHPTNCKPKQSANKCNTYSILEDLPVMLDFRLT
ncbi:hypothetical protein CLF_111045 [Clonorchis sinensis]|uniref:Uncharacterized protein n=1 Tax=Clonorchis sinensis TaxID=79923 RepID=G7YU89_CLOSI|nr:hypothetical protein CLF_111045 [Clonorchis sinensis]